MKKLFALVLIAAALFIGLNLSSSKAAEVISDIPENPQHALILIHGFGQDGARMQTMAASFKDKLPDTAFFYPTSPDKTPFRGHQWFDLPVYGPQMVDVKIYQKMLDGALDNVPVLQEVIDNIHNDLGMPYENISIAGFSQGGLMAVLTALTTPHPLNKAISFSGVPFVITEDFDTGLIVSAPQILLIQGDNDSAIPPSSINLTKSALESIGIYPQTEIIAGMRHEINQTAKQKFLEFFAPDI